MPSYLCPLAKSRTRTRTQYQTQTQTQTQTQKYTRPRPRPTCIKQMKRQKRQLAIIYCYNNNVKVVIFIYHRDSKRQIDTANSIYPPSAPLHLLSSTSHILSSLFYFLSSIFELALLPPLSIDSFRFDSIQNFKRSRSRQDHSHAYPSLSTRTPPI